MRISDWSSDVCSSDLELAMAVAAARRLAAMAIDGRGLRGLEEITFGMGERGGVGAANDAEENVLENVVEHGVRDRVVDEHRTQTLADAPAPLGVQCGRECRARGVRSLGGGGESAVGRAGSGKGE